MKNAKIVFENGHMSEFVKFDEDGYLEETAFENMEIEIVDNSESEDKMFECGDTLYMVEDLRGDSKVVQMKKTKLNQDV